MRFCRTSVDCTGLPPWNRCIYTAVVPASGETFRSCTFTCNPVTGDPCPADRNCILGIQSGEPYVMCTNLSENLGLDEPCTDATQCARGLNCINDACRQLCVVGGADVCPRSSSCAPISPALDLGEGPLGACL
jgi:hypothetical protein